MTTKEIEINGKKCVVHKSDAAKPGIVYGPYLPTNDIPLVNDKSKDKGDDEYNQFMTEYIKQHCCCPKCGSKNFTTTLAGYIFNSAHPEEYKDKNSCYCLDCGWRGIRHELAPEQKRANI